MEIRLHRLVVSRDIPALDSSLKVRIRHAISQKLGANPALYGSPLRGELKGLWKLRVGDWRVVYSIEPNLIFIYMIAHRKNVYTLLLKRIYNGRTQ